MAEPQAVVKAERPKKGPKVLDEIRIKRSMDGGHVVTHHYEGYQHDPRPYRFSPAEAGRAKSHIMRHAGLPGGQADAGESEEEPED